MFASSGKGRVYDDDKVFGEKAEPQAESSRTAQTDDEEIAAPFAAQQRKWRENDLAKENGDVPPVFTDIAREIEDLAAKRANN